MIRKHRAATLFAAAALLLAGCTSPSGGTDDDGPEPLPDVALSALGAGQGENLSDLRGPMVINLFAQWCKPCRKELPYYQQLHERAGKKLAVLGIDYLDQQPDDALALTEAAGVTYPLLADPDGELRVQFEATYLPIVAFVDAEGDVVHVEKVQIESYQQLAGLVREHLGVSL